MTDLLMAADCPQSAEMYRSMGYHPVEVDIGEFQKLEGCVTCLSVRLRLEPRWSAANAGRWARNTHDGQSNRELGAAPDAGGVNPMCS